MYEDANGTMVPGSVFKQMMHFDLHHRIQESKSVITLFEDQPPQETNVIQGDDIDGDASIEEMLEEYGC